MVIGILAHVDAGKTTLSESLLYHTGAIRSKGRVDYGNTFLDTDSLEKKRGITIYSKEAVFSLGDRQVYLLDTPGHVDFSAEMERTLQVLDYAILVINAADGVQAHTATLWKLLQIYNVPAFIFVNKMDQPASDKASIMKELGKLSAGSAVDFTDLCDGNTLEAIAMCDEEVLEYFMENGNITEEMLQSLIVQRKLFPCYFGSALKDIGIEEFLNGFCAYTKEKEYADKQGAKIFKVVRDNSGTRLTYMKITGGSLKVKEIIEDIGEKADQIRVYSGEKYKLLDEAVAGTVCAVTGLTKTYPGQGVGVEAAAAWSPVLEPVLMYRLAFPKGTDMQGMIKNLKQLEEEEPQLHIIWNERLGEVYAKVMGAVQTEILKSVIRERYGVEVEFDSGNIVYKETITDIVEGVGHFEPLRHYAEVHLLIEPLPPGSGLVFEAKCSEDMLDKNWQRLILTHLGEKEHIGVLTGSPVTDVKITLMSGKAHQKHTEGGDFRQATYRAVRHGLKQAHSLLLEPYYAFRLELPADTIGRAMSDLQRMYANFETEKNDGVNAVIVGKCPVSTMNEYSSEVTSYTKGMGKLYHSVCGYDKCHNADEIIDKTGYDSESDIDNPTGSMFCAHGAGYYVPWDRVKECMHLESILKKDKSDIKVFKQGQKKENTDYYAGEKELEEIFDRTYGTGYKEKRAESYKKTIRYNDNNAGGREYVYKGTKEKCEEYLLVDGYNIIFAWEDLNELAKVNLDAARMKLQDILCNYQGYKKCNLIVVFDAYKVQGNKGSTEQYKNIYVVYTREAETADQYIEKTVHDIGKKHRVTVATSDRLEQMIIMGDGAMRMSARGFREEIEKTEKSISEAIQAGS